MDFLDDVLGIDQSGEGLTGSLGATILTDPLEDGLKSITGQAAEDAARAGGARAEEAGQRAITLGNEAQLRLEETLAPFVQALGADLIPRVGGLFGAGAGAAIQSDPVLQALQADAEQRVLNSQSARGRAGAGGTEAILANEFMRTGSDFLSRERGDLLSALQFGQSSAAQTGVSGVNNARSAGDLLTQIANSQNAAAIGGAGARSQGIKNLLEVGSTAASMFGGGA